MRRRAPKAAKRPCSQQEAVITADQDTCRRASPGLTWACQREPLSKDGSRNRTELCYNRLLAGPWGEQLKERQMGKQLFSKLPLVEPGQECLAWRQWVAPGTVTPLTAPSGRPSEGMTAFCV